MSAGRLWTLCLLAKYFIIFTGIETQALYDRAMRSRTQENPLGKNTNVSPKTPGSDTISSQINLIKFAQEINTHFIRLDNIHAEQKVTSINDSMINDSWASFIH